MASTAAFENRKRLRNGEPKVSKDVTNTTNGSNAGKIGGKHQAKYRNSNIGHSRGASDASRNGRHSRNSGACNGDSNIESQGQTDRSYSTGKLHSQKRRPLIVAQRQDWFNFDYPVVTSTTPKPLSISTELFEYGMQLLKEDNENYATAQTKSSFHNFYSTILSSGTLSDKVSALTLSIQESPLHNMHALETLVALAKKRSRSQAVQVLGALKDLFSAGTILPSDRRLRTFATQVSLVGLSSTDTQDWNDSIPLPSPLTKAHVAIWAFEDWLKAIYLQIIKLIEVWCNDEIVFSRLKAVDYVFELLREKPEQEANLLRLLVNKLGDRERKVASRASYNLIQLQVPHPSMKQVIVSTIELDVLFKPNQSMSAKYYAVITLNQTVLDGNQQELVSKILDIYFTLFLSSSDDSERHSARAGVQDNRPSSRRNLAPPIGRDQGGKFVPPLKHEEIGAESKDKFLSAILTGINRAVPFAGSKDEFFEKHLDTLFAITHAANFNTSMQALLLVEQICGSHSAASDRFYRTLYESLLDQRLFSSSKQDLFVNLLYRVLCADLNTKRVFAFVKRVIQVTALYEPTFACKMIYLTKKLSEFFPSLLTLLDQPEALYNEVDGERAESSPPPNSSKPQRFAMGSEAAVSYDGKKRDPQFSNADRSCLWESGPLLYHYHPSVSLFASKLQQPKEEILTKPEQTSHSLISFLDRFVYRNPKKRTRGLRGASLMQPLAARSSSAGLLLNPQGRREQIPLSMEASRGVTGSDKELNAHEVFFHKYFNVKGKGRKITADKQSHDIKPSSTEDEAFDDHDMLKEDEIWKSLVDSRPELDADDDSDFDFGSELGSLDFAVSEDDADELNHDSESNLSNVEDSEEDVEISKGTILTSDVHSTYKSNEDKAPTARKRKKTLKSLPVFASAGDYEEMLRDLD